MYNVLALLRSGVWLMLANPAVSLFLARFLNLAGLINFYAVQVLVNCLQPKVMKLVVVCHS